jgi:hypothetical protein
MCVFSLSRARVKRLVIEEITSTDSTLLCSWQNNCRCWKQIELL